MTSPRNLNRYRLGGLLAAVLALAALTGSLKAEPRPSSDLLLPYFEVSLGTGPTTLFSVVSSGDEPVDVRLAVFSNWGVEVIASRITLAPGHVRSVNLADWIVRGQLPDRTLNAAQRAHLQAALTGELSPETDLYYGTQIEPDLATGFVEIRIDGLAKPDILWGDYFLVDPSQDYAQGDVLVNIDRGSECPDLCLRHALRYLDGGGFDGGTQIILWTGERGQPSRNAFFPKSSMTDAATAVYDEQGRHLDERALELLPTQVVTVAELGLAEPFGWLDMLSDSEIFVAVRFSASQRFSVGLTSYCLPLPPPSGEQPRIHLEKATNGIDADSAPGPSLDLGGAVEWTYRVSNTGDVPLASIAVTDDQGVAVTCPGVALEPGESMTCTGQGTAEVCGYRNVGTARGIAAGGLEVFDTDPSHYNLDENPSVRIEKATNGHDADTGPGPSIGAGDPVSWTYVVTNDGDVALSGIAVTDDQGEAVSCPRSSLQSGQSMTCTANGTAVLGAYRNVGSVTATSNGPCGTVVTDSDPSHYTGVCDDNPNLDIEKATNGHDADTAPGPAIAAGHPVTWTYFVHNTGDVSLANVLVSDDQGVAVSCPASTLAPGQSMSCFGSGTAILGPYQNIGTATGRSGGSCAATVSDSDPSHYTGVCVEQPGIHIEKATNGHDADTAPGPTVREGDPVTWTYAVTNTGDVVLSNVAVSDDQGVAVSCPGSTLAPGQSMTCTGSGLAVEGQYRNVGTATAISSCGTPVSASDPSHYLGRACLPAFRFESDGFGNALSKGQIIDDEWANLGVHVTTNDPSRHPLMIFDSASPTGGDWDLGTPNEDFGGPGIGSGGEAGGGGPNTQALGKVLIISEDGSSSNPNDHARGGTITFNFDFPTDVHSVEILDIDNSHERGTVKAYGSSGQLLVSRQMQALGNNSYQEIFVGASDATKLKITFPKSGAMPGIVFCPQ